MINTNSEGEIRRVCIIAVVVGIIVASRGKSAALVTHDDDCDCDGVSVLVFRLCTG